MAGLLGRIAAEAKALQVYSETDPKITAIALRLGVSEQVVQKQLRSIFGRGLDPEKALERFSARDVDVVPAGSKGAGRTRVVDALHGNVAMSSSKPWDPIRKLPPGLRARLSEGDEAMIRESVAALQAAVKKARLDYVPVFGYLSLRTHNFRELGKESQEEVVAGRDIVAATLPGHDLDVVAITVFRGTPEHPGVVAGLSQREGGSVPGTLLKLPLARAEELLAVVIAREFFAEGDLVDRKDRRGNLFSNAMYKPVVKPVVLEDGSKVPALVFITNPTGAKALRADNAFGDGRGLTKERLAFHLAADGGFTADGNHFGGACGEYWATSYFAAREAAGQPVDPEIAAALELSKLWPQQHVLLEIAEARDPEAMLMLDALGVLFLGAAVPVSFRREQQPSSNGLTRTRHAEPGGATREELLAKAKELKAKGKLEA